MITFSEFRLSGDSDKNEAKMLEVIRKGINLQRGEDFWEDLLSLCANAEGMSKLLDIPKEKITGLGNKINKLKNKIEQIDKTKPKDKLINTGDV